MTRIEKGSYAKIVIGEKYVTKKPLDNNDDTLYSFIREKEYLEYLKDLNCVVNMIEVNGTTIKLEKGETACGTFQVLIDKGEYVSQLFEAIKAVHSKGIIHNDIKPENIIHVDSTVKLIDFGISYPMTTDKHPLNMLGWSDSEYIRKGVSNSYIDDYRCLDSMLSEQECEPIDYTLHDIVPNFEPVKHPLPNCKLKIDKKYLKHLPIDQLVRCQFYKNSYESLFIHYQPEFLFETSVKLDKIKQLMNETVPLTFWSFHYSKSELIKKYC